MPSTSVQQECLTRVFQSIVRERGRERECVCVLPECATRVSSKSVRQECLTRVSHKSVPQECPTRVCHKRVTKECPTRLSEKSVKQECSAFNAIEHLLFAFHCSVGTLPFFYVSFKKMHSGSQGITKTILDISPQGHWPAFSAYFSLTNSRNSSAIFSCGSLCCTVLRCFCSLGLFPLSQLLQ